MDKRKVKEAKDAKLKAAGTDKKKDRVRCFDGRARASAPTASDGAHTDLLTLPPHTHTQAAADKDKVATGAALSLSDLRGGKGGKKGGEKAGDKVGAKAGGAGGAGGTAPPSKRAPPPPKEPKKAASDSYLGDLDLPSSESDTDSGGEGRGFKRDEKADISLVRRRRGGGRERERRREERARARRGPTPQPAALHTSHSHHQPHPPLPTPSGHRAGQQAHRGPGAQSRRAGRPREGGRPGGRRQRFRCVL